MGQYCRYCANCLISESNGGAHCCVKKKDIAESTAKHVNHCKDYELVQCDEKEYMDFFMESIYTPRKEKTTNEQVEQFKLF